MISFLLPAAAVLIGLPASPSVAKSPPSEKPVIEAPRAALDVAFGMRVVTFSQSAPPNWKQVADRHHQQVVENTLVWTDMVALLEGDIDLDLITRVNRTVNRATYVPDLKNWGEEDYWATPMELFAYGGDCEDYAIAKYFILRELGVKASDLHLVIEKNHAFLIVQTEFGNYVLDNRTDRVRPLTPSSLRSMVFSVNEVQWSISVDRGQQQWASFRTPSRAHSLFGTDTLR